MSRLMSKTLSENRNHCEPEVLVDLAESFPVDARAHTHLKSCNVCSSRVAELQSTLAELSQEGSAEPDESYWAGFGARLGRLLAESDDARPSRRLWVPYAAAAAAVLCAVALARQLALVGGSGSEHQALASLLPPIDEDAEFQFLASVAYDASSGEDLESLLSGPSSLAEDSSFTEQEEGLLVEKLKQVLEGKADAKS